MTILMDITRIFRRALQFTPTGIDRVELAYALHLLQVPADVHYIVRYRSHVWPLRPAAVPRFLATLAARWEGADAAAKTDEIARLERFLGLPAGALAAPPARRAPPAPDIRPLFATLFSPGAGITGALSRPVGRGAVYLNVSHEGLTFPGEVEQLARARGWKPVYLIHDLIPLTHPEYVREGDEAKHDARMSQVLNTAAAIIYNSRDTEEAMAAFARRKGRALPPGIVSLLGIEAKFQSPADAPPPVAGHPYFVMLGTIEPRKNHLLLLHVWRRLAELKGAATPKLVLVGRRGWENENILDLLDRATGLKPHVFECNRLPDGHLKRLLQGARAMLFPSFAEGYGLPLAEALALGVPVIASDLPVFQEIAGDLPCYRDPIDGLGWMAAIADFGAPQSVARAAQVAALPGFRVPTWAQHFAATDALILGLAP
ncbi:glycosyltransferase family 4 protein [Xanthobacter agilis]|uniref:Glycosyltransferase involved in cell wall biosynthesis n=1 Tax=Xanthobacter agilis TaxID=47492 RepID=A0ABU0LCK1_XANAG|nr:glycosyltransferase family 1 protein [Xanthobacter agilis]MDQ0504877.1 glycosyltransferase involved in cell wall biosynthesis [Xanthobacter agilis]